MNIFKVSIKLKLTNASSHGVFFAFSNSFSSGFVAVVKYCFVSVVSSVPPSHPILYISDPIDHAWNEGRFPFDQKFRKFRVGEQMERTFSGISFQNFGSTSRGCPNILENRNNRKILFHSTILSWPSFSEA